MITLVPAGTTHTIGTVGTPVTIDTVSPSFDVAITVTAFAGTSVEFDLVSSLGVLDTLAVTGVGTYVMRGVGGTNVRINTSLTGVSPSVTFGAVAEVAQCYANLADIVAQAVAERAIEEIPNRDRVGHLIAASAEVEGYLASAYQLPLTAWGADLRRCAAQLAAAGILRVRGADYMGPDGIVFRAETDARSWLRNIANGRITPGGIVDTTVDDYEGGLAIASRTPRRWA